MKHGEWVTSAVSVTAQRSSGTGRASRSSARTAAASAEASLRSLASGESERKLRVLVCSADPFTRRAFGSGASAPDIDVVARSNLTDAVETLAAELEPDVVVLDVQVAAATALRTLQQLRSQVPAARILACDAPATPEFGMLCLLAGAAGYMSKEADLAALPRILRRLAAGEAVTSRELASELVHRFVSAGRRAPSRSDRRLSGPESQVLELLRTGQSLAQIADQLSIRPATARRHLGSARRKLSARPAMEVAGGRPHIHETDELEVR